MLNSGANLLSQIDLIILDDTCLGVDKTPLQLGIKVNKEPAQLNLGKGLLNGKEMNNGIPQGIGPDPFKDFHLLPWDMLRMF